MDPLWSMQQHRLQNDHVPGMARRPLGAVGTLRTDQSRDERVAGDVTLPGGYGGGGADCEEDRGTGSRLGEEGPQGRRSEAGDVEDSVGVWAVA